MSPVQRYFVRIGSLAEIHVADGEPSISPGRRVIVRTPRGVELGWIAAPLRDRTASPQPTTRILRPTTEEDELLLRRLERHKRQAVEACRAALRDCGSMATLLDVDQIFDGCTLVMHFLGTVDEKAQTVTEQIVEHYEAVVRTRHFAKLLDQGCGPGCGSGEAAGCGTGGCSQCGLSQACRVAS